MGFRFTKRYDAQIAKDGVWFDIVTEADDLIGKFKCRYIDPYGVEIDTIRNRIRNKYATQLRDRNAYDLLGAALLLADEIVTDWEEIYDEDGELVPFSIEKAIEFFCHPEARYTVVKLTDLVGNPVYFGGEPAGDFVKN